MVLFKSYNIEQLYKLLVVNDPFTENLDRKKEVRRHIVRTLDRLKVTSSSKLNQMKVKSNY